MNGVFKVPYVYSLGVQCVTPLGKKKKRKKIMFEPFNGSFSCGFDHNIFYKIKLKIIKVLFNTNLHKTFLCSLNYVFQTSLIVQS